MFHNSEHAFENGGIKMKKYDIDDICDIILILMNVMFGFILIIGGLFCNLNMQIFLTTMGFCCMIFACLTELTHNIKYFMGK